MNWPFLTWMNGEGVSFGIDVQPIKSADKSDFVYNAKVGRMEIRN